MTDLTNAAPISFGGSTHMPVMSMTFTPGVSTELIRHSGLPFASGSIVPTVAPVLQFQTFYGSAISLLSGFKLVRFTDVKMYLRGYANGIAGGTGDQWSIKTGAQAFAHIVDVSEGAGGQIVANVQVFFLSGGALNGIDDIFERTPNVTIPTPTEPTYYVRGPVSIGGVVTPGATSFALSTGNRAIPITPTDGRTYADGIIYDGGDRSITIGHDGIRALLQAITARGVDINATPCIVYLRQISRRGVVVTTVSSGASISIAKGRIDLDALNQSVGAQNTGGITIRAINESNNQDDPFTHSMAATVP